MMYLPRLCEHCLNPACVAACPSGAIYKREEDGIVLIDQDKCRGWRMCVSACPYKKIYYNWSSRQVGEVHLLLPAHRGGAADGVFGNLRRPHPLSRRDALRRRPHRGGGVRCRTRAIFTKHSSRSSSIRTTRVCRRRRAPTAFPRPGWRRRGTRRSGRWRWTGRSPSRCIPNTARCRWSGTCRRCRRSRPPRRKGDLGEIGGMPDVKSLRIPVRYLANLLTAGRTEPVELALERMLAMRAYMRAKTVDGVDRRRHRRTRRPVRRRHRGHVPPDGDRQLRGPLRHPDRASRDRRGRLRVARLLRLLLRRGCSGKTGFDLFGATSRARQDADGGRSDGPYLSGALAALLSYPTDGVAGRHRRDRRTSWPRRASSPRTSDAPPSDGCWTSSPTTDIYELQERYFALFDRSRTLSLHLFEHVHGESRDRGQAMADLVALYAATGWMMAADELPDFLPLFLEFLSLLPEARGARDAGRTGRHPARPGRPAGQTQTPAMSRHGGACGTRRRRRARGAPAIPEEDPDDLAAMDAAWEEAAVRFGPGEASDGCGTDRLRRRACARPVAQRCQRA